MAAHVQTVSKDLTDGSQPGTTITVTLTPTAGNALIVVASAATVGGDTLTVADDKSDSFSAPVASISAAFTPSAAYMWVATNVAGGSTVVTVTAASSDYLSLVVSEFSGLTASPIDQSGTNANQLTPNPPTVTASGATVQADEVIYAFHNCGYGGATEVWTATAGYTIPTNGGLRDSVAEYRIVASIGTYTSSPAQSASPAGGQSILGTFKSAASAVAARFAGLMTLGVGT